MDTRLGLSILIGAVFASIFFTTLFFFISQSCEVQEIEMHLQVDNYTGFKLNTDMIYFGTITPGGSGSRNITVTNKDLRTKKIFVTFSGDLSRWVSAYPNSFLLSSNESRIITLNVRVPENAIYGNYTGIVRIILLPTSHLSSVG